MEYRYTTSDCDTSNTIVDARSIVIHIRDPDRTRSPTTSYQNKIRNVLFFSHRSYRHFNPFFVFSRAIEHSCNEPLGARKKIANTTFIRPIQTRVQERFPFFSVKKKHATLSSCEWDSSTRRNLANKCRTVCYRMVQGNYVIADSFHLTVNIRRRSRDSRCCTILSMGIFNSRYTKRVNVLSWADHCLPCGLSSPYMSGVRELGQKHKACPLSDRDTANNT